jgi:hypothetical protein
MVKRYTMRPGKAQKRWSRNKKGKWKKAENIYTIGLHYL